MEGRRRRKGGRAPSLVQFGLPIGRGRGHPLWAASPLSYGPCRPNIPPGGSVNPPVLRYVPGMPRNTFVSEYHRPIYESLPLDHFETPRNVVISSGTPNNIRSPNHITQIIQNHDRTLSMRTLRVRELCRHDRDTSPVNNQ